MGLTIDSLPPKHTLIKNLLIQYDKATEAEKYEGRGFYPAAWNDCVLLSTNEIMPEQVAGVMAIVSPGMVWDVNKSAPARILDLVERDVPVEEWAGFTTYRRNLEKANKLIKERDWSAIRGDKVSSFYMNILGNTLVVTIDRWMVRAMLNSPYVPKDMLSPSSTKTYRHIELIVREAAALAGETPADFQAIVWVQYRNAHLGRVRMPTRNLEVNAHELAEAGVVA